MALFHSHIQVITRGNGKTAVAAAAYRAGTIITNEYDGITHDYLHKAGIIYTEILLPPQAPEEYKNRAVLWNAVEKVEKAKNSQLARELNIAIPHELTKEQGIALAKEYVKTAFVDEGMCADLCIHDAGNGNPHFHVMLTMRPINEDGTWGGKNKKEYFLDDEGKKIYDPVKRQYKCRSVPTTDWNNRNNADKWRGIWQDMANATLEKYGHDSRIDRRSYAEQGIELVPTVHLGAAVIQMEKKGIRTERGDINRRVAEINKEIRMLNSRMTQVDKWLDEIKTEPDTPSLLDVIDELSRRHGVSKNTRLHNMVDVGNFLIRNEIHNYDELESKADEMHEKLSDVSKELKGTERRIETLHKHITQSVNYKQYRKHKLHFDKLRAEHKDAKNATGIMSGFKEKKAHNAANDYYQKYKNEITLFDEADKYLRNILQSHFVPGKPPMKKWERELTEKLQKRDVLSSKVNTLKDEAQKVEQIKRSVGRLLSGDMSDFTATATENRRSKNAQSQKPSIIAHLRDFGQNKEKYRQHAPAQRSGKSHDMEL